MVIWWMVSGTNDAKSQNISAEGQLVAGWRFWVWMKSGNLLGSLVWKSTTGQREGRHTAHFRTTAAARNAPDEEHGRVVANQIPVAFLGVELYREATGVTRSVRTAHTRWRIRHAHMWCYCSHATHLPFSPPTVLNRTKQGVRLPTALNILARQNFEMS